MNSVIIGIGSNINPDENVREALRLLGEITTVIKVSSMIRTKPLGISDQPDFTNGAVRVTTPHSKTILKELLKGIEDKLQRDRSLPKYGPRTIDLDIISWNGQIVDPDYYSRDFLRQAVEEVK